MKKFFAALILLASVSLSAKAHTGCDDKVTKSPTLILRDRILVFMITRGGQEFDTPLIHLDLNGLFTAVLKRAAPTKTFKLKLIATDATNYSDGKRAFERLNKAWQLVVENLVPEMIADPFSEECFHLAESRLEARISKAAYAEGDRKYLSRSIAQSSKNGFIDQFLTAEGASPDPKTGYALSANGGILNLKVYFSPNVIDAFFKAENQRPLFGQFLQTLKLGMDGVDRIYSGNRRLVEIRPADKTLNSRIYGCLDGLVLKLELFATEPEANVAANLASSLCR